MHSEGVEIAHVGDSRCYLLQAGQAFQITKDHTVVQKMVDAQLLSPAQAAAHPDANQILRALGTSADIEVEVRAQSIPLADGDAFVLCSDGLSDLVEPQEIFGIVMGAPAAKAAGQLVELANARGGHDNVTVMILRRENGATAARESAKGVAQTLFEMPAMAMAPAPGVAPTLAGVPAVTSQPAAAASDPTSSGPHLPVAPPPPPRRSRISAVVVFGVILGIVGFGAVGFAVFLLLNPRRDAKVVAPFALSGAPLVAPPPSVALVPVAPKPLPVFGDGAPPAPLPSLTPPTRTLRHGHGP
jgi:protein phosphatase